MDSNSDFMKAINKIANDVLNPSASKTKGTSYWYTMGSVGNKKVQYTRAKTGYQGKWGFWSWIATEYKNGRTIRRKFAKSASRASAEKRAERLLEGLKKHDNTKYKCILCNEDCTGYGNNPYPLKTYSEGKCCDKCNVEKVIPARLEEMK